MTYNMALLRSRRPAHLFVTGFEVMFALAVFYALDATYTAWELLFDRCLGPPKLRRTRRFWALARRAFMAFAAAALVDWIGYSADLWELEHAHK